MTFIATLNVIAKSVFTILIFVIINQESDYIWVHALWGLSYIIIDLIAFFLIRFKLKLQFSLPKTKQIKSILGISFEYFLSRIAIALYLNTNIIFIGILLSPTEAGIYGGAEKLLFAITTFYAPLIETIYPYVSRTKNKQFIKNTYCSCICKCLRLFGCIFNCPIIIPLVLGQDFNAAIPLFRWMMIIALLHLPASIIGYPVLGAMGYVKTANRSVIIGPFFIYF